MSHIAQDAPKEQSINEQDATHLQILYHRLYEGEQNVEPVFDVDVGGGFTQTNAGDSGTLCQILVATVVA